MYVFANQNSNARIIRKFMTDDEYELSKRHLKINARGWQENKFLSKYVMKIEKWNNKSQISRV